MNQSKELRLKFENSYRKDELVDAFESMRSMRDLTSSNLNSNINNNNNLANEIETISDNENEIENENDTENSLKTHLKFLNFNQNFSNPRRSGIGNLFIFVKIKFNATKKKLFSSTGILEFSPSMAGNDVTPANFDFSNKKFKKTVANTSFQSLAGKYLPLKIKIKYSFHK